MRLNRYIAESGACSRRQADAWIAAGRVTVNGTVATLGTQVREGDVVRIDGRPVAARTGKRVYIALNKPIGIECTAARDVPDNIVDFVGYPERIYPVGRLDKNSEGLILLTNDGELANELLRAANRHEKEYEVAVDKPLTADFLQGMASGVPILDTVTAPCKIHRTGRCTFRIVLIQGMNRQIRRMCEYFGYHVTRLKRIRIGPLTLGSLKPGEWKELTENEVNALPGKSWRGHPITEGTKPS